MNAFKKNLPTLTIFILIFLCVPFISFASSWGESILWNLVNTLFGTLMGLAGLLLNVGVQDFVIGFGDQFLTHGAGVVVDALWTNVRDIFNITFIFGLVYIGFKMILNSDDSNTRRWLVSLILAALLVNFSLYITKLIVDFTNILATQIVTGGFQTSQISDAFMNTLGLTSLWGVNIGGSSTLPTDGAYGYIFGAAMLFIVGTFVFAAGGIMLIIRYAALCLYMVMSPLMFLGWVFPGLQSVTSSYWKGFLGRAFFAPVYVLLLYFAYSILDQFYKGGGQSPNFQALFTGGGSSALGGGVNFQATLPPFILSCIFLIAAIVVANKLSADGATQAINVGNKMKGWGQQKLQNGVYRTGRVARAPLAAGARRTSYALGSSLDRNINRMQQSNSKIVRTVAGTNLVDSAVRGSSASLRNSKFGLNKTHEEEVKQRNETHSRSESGMSYSKQKEELARQRTRLAAQEKIINDQTKSAAEKTAAQAEADQAKSKIKDAQNALGSEIRQMSNGALLSLPAEDLQSADIAKHLTDSQLATIQNSGRYTNDEISGKLDASGNRNGGIKGARDNGTFADIESSLDGATTSATELGAALGELGKTIRDLSNERVQNLGMDRLTSERVAMNLTQTQIDSLQASGKFSAEDMDKIKKAKERGLTAVATGNLTTPQGANGTGPSIINSNNSTNGKNSTLVQSQQKNLMGGNVQQVGQLPVSVFTQPAMAQYITPQVLEQRMKNGGVSNTDLDAIRLNIDTHINNLFISNPAEATRTKNQWSTWNQRSPYGGQLGLTSI